MSFRPRKAIAENDAQREILVPIGIHAQTKDPRH
jgi:hypothetical protein